MIFRKIISDNYFIAVRFVLGRSTHSFYDFVFSGYKGSN